MLPPGLSAYWTTFRDVKVEVVDARAIGFVHPDLPVILKSQMIERVLECVTVPAGHVGVWFTDGAFVETLGPGRYAFWKQLAEFKVVTADTRELILDVAGQEIMTADKVTLRLNAVVTYKVADPVKAVTTVEDHRQALYREAQLALRAVVGTRELDVLLGDKDAVARELDGIVRARVAGFGLEVVALGIRDVILPGEMKDLMNKVTEAKKAADAIAKSFAGDTMPGLTTTTPTP